MPELRPLRPVPQLATALALGLALGATSMARQSRVGASDRPLVVEAFHAAVAPLVANAGLVPVDVPASGRLTATLYDPAGARVRVLVDDAPHARGPAHLPWDGLDESGRPAPAGAYAVKLEVRSARVRALRMSNLRWPLRGPGV